MDGRKAFVPYWLRRSEESLQKDVMIILGRCNAIRRLATNTNGEGDEADLEGARVDLKDSLVEISSRGDTGDNPLWAAVMMIRPQVINGRMATSVTEEISQALWDLKEDCAEKQADKAELFGKLAGRLRRHQINFFRTVISGGQLIAKEKNGEWRNHYFPGIPFAFRTEAGVKLSTSPENMPAVIKAYKVMAEKTIGNARTAIDAVIADMETLSKGLYPQKKI
ncbi:MAG: hypothetical protein HYW69_01410 [Candidatus Nealsonbacteria bacterium]|nr:hypothetical protein [Candidatus Nealsonbacteria bacterium]